ncbi:hypothetical protein RUND412_006678 [Rhizina undulata]
MESLPTEIIQEIVGHLSGDDLDSVRLVSRELSVVAAVFKYRTLRVPVSRKGLKHLLLVSQQPALASCVREIIHPWGYLPPVEPAYGSSLAKFTRYVSIFVKWYNKKLYSPQTKLEDSGECVTALEAALPRMSNIRVIQPFFSQDIENVKGAFDKWCKAQTGFRRRAIIDVEWGREWVYSLRTIHTEDSKARGAKQILDLIDVSNRAGLKPQRLAIGSSITSEPPVLLPTFFADSVGVLENDLVNVLRRHSGTLDTLSLDAFSLSGGACKDHFLPPVKNLTSLSLYLDGPYQSKDGANFESLEEAIKGGSISFYLQPQICGFYR